MSHRVRHYHKPRSQNPGTPATQGASGTPTLVLSTAASTVNQSGVAFSTFPVVQLQDGLGNNIAQAGVNVLINVSPSPSVSQAITPTGGSPALTDATGKLTYTAFSLSGLAGSYVLTWTATGYTNTTQTISLTAGAPNPANFTASVPSPVNQNQVRTVTVQARDSAGNACTSATNTVVENVNGANVHAGTVTNNNNGTYSCTDTPTNVGTDTITITADGTAISGSPFTSVVQQVFTLTYPSLPSGYPSPTAFTTDDFTTITEGNWSILNPTLSVRNASTYNPINATAPRNPPISPQSIGEALFPAGFSGSGIAPGELFTASFAGNNWAGLYVMATVQLSSNWQSHPSGVNKVLTGNIHSNPCFVLSATNGTAWQFRLQNLGISLANPNLDANLVAAPVTKGLWQRVEVQLIANTAGVSNGVVRLWLTNYNASGVITSGPTKTHEYTNIGWSSNAQATIWQSLAWNPIWGGTSTTATVTNQMYMWMDHIAYTGHA